MKKEKLVEAAVKMNLVKNKTAARKMSKDKLQALVVNNEPIEPVKVIRRPTPKVLPDGQMSKEQIAAIIKEAFPPGRHKIPFGSMRMHREAQARRRVNNRRSHKKNLARRRNRVAALS